MDQVTVSPCEALNGNPQVKSLCEKAKEILSKESNVQEVKQWNQI